MAFYLLNLSCSIQPGDNGNIVLPRRLQSKVPPSFWMLVTVRNGRSVPTSVDWLDEADYPWTGLKRTPAFRELHLTAKLLNQGLSMSHPVAARVTRHGLTYEAALAGPLENGEADAARNLLVDDRTGYG